MLELKQELEQEIIEWKKVIDDLDNHCKRYQPSKYLTLIKNKAQTNIEHIQKRLDKDSSPVEPEVILPKPNPQVFTLADLEKAYNDGYKNGIMNEAGLECEPFSVWYNWVHIIKSKNRSEA